MQQQNPHCMNPGYFSAAHIGNPRKMGASGRFMGAPTAPVPYNGYGQDDQAGLVNKVKGFYAQRPIVSYGITGLLLGAAGYFIYNRVVR